MKKNITNTKNRAGGDRGDAPVPRAETLLQPVGHDHTEADICTVPCGGWMYPCWSRWIFLKESAASGQDPLWSRKQA